MSRFVIKSRHSINHLRRKKPDAVLVDLTSRGPQPWVRFSPFYPHGDIPVPFTPNRMGASVEGIWQGLKVFESEDVDPARFDITSMKGLKRTVRKYGKCLGHRRGVDGAELLQYLDARKQIYVPTYRWVLEKYLTSQLAQLAAMAGEDPIILLDYETNGDVENLSRPLSHAGLVVAYLEGRYPSYGE